MNITQCVQLPRLTCKAIGLNTKAKNLLAGMLTKSDYSLGRAIGRKLKV